MDQGLGELFEAVKKSVRSGAVVPSDPEINEAVRTLWEPVKAMRKNLKISLDAASEIVYGLCCSQDIEGKLVKTYIAYIRTSGNAKGHSGLDADAQRNSIADFAHQRKGKVLKEFCEVETGNKRNLRPELKAALAYAKKTGAVLLIAKLDRLDVGNSLLVELLESEVNYIACDNLFASKLTVLFMLAIAEHERQLAACRTKEALGKAKARGVALGSNRPGHWEGREDARLKGGVKGRKIAAKVISTAAREAYRDIEPMIRSWREEGLSLQKIATRLNEAGYQTRRGANFTPVQVSSILKRME